MKFRLLAFLMMFAVACMAGEPKPAQPDESSMCAQCRMRVSDLRFATQLVAPGEEPRFFDDLGCMRRHLTSTRTEARWRAFVSDYATSKWIPAADATYWKCASIETPMSSHLVTTSSKEKPAEDCAAMTAIEVFGPEGAPAGK